MPNYNREWLRTQVASYIKDTPANALSDVWIDLGAKRVSELLRCREMETEITRAAGDADSFITLDRSIKRVMGVQAEYDDGNYRHLDSVPSHDAWRYKRDGIPSVYYVSLSKIHPLPRSDRNYKAQVLAEVVIPETLDGEVDALSQYPSLYLNAALSEAYDWKQDENMRNYYQQKWIEEAQRITATYENEYIGDVPAMRAS